ncbi:MAG: hypothetical protein ACKERG_04625 [Candidatus Hodgkinia cicadicola]
MLWKGAKWWPKLGCVEVLAAAVLEGGNQGSGGGVLAAKTSVFIVASTFMELLSFQLKTWAW